MEPAPCILTREELASFVDLTNDDWLEEGLLFKMNDGVCYIVILCYDASNTMICCLTPTSQHNLRAETMAQLIENCSDINLRCSTCVQKLNDLGTYAPFDDADRLPKDDEENFPVDQANTDDYDWPISPASTSLYLMDEEDISLPQLPIDPLERKIALLTTPQEHLRTQDDPLMGLDVPGSLRYNRLVDPATIALMQAIVLRWMVMPAMQAKFVTKKMAEELTQDTAISSALTAHIYRVNTLLYKEHLFVEEKLALLGYLATQLIQLRRINYWQAVPNIVPMISGSVRELIASNKLCNGGLNDEELREEWRRVTDLLRDNLPGY